jgi:hypothetical protein
MVRQDLESAEVLTKMFADEIKRLISKYNIQKKFLEKARNDLTISNNDLEDAGIRIDSDKEVIDRANAEIERLKGYNDEAIKVLKKEREESANTIKAREAEANSYRDLYNELKEAIYKGIAKPFSQSKTRAEVLYEIKNMHDKIKHQEKIIELARESDARLYAWGNNWKNKYRRLYDLLRKRFRYDSSYNVLKEHRDNEAKLKKKRGK